MFLISNSSLNLIHYSWDERPFYFLRIKLIKTQQTKKRKLEFVKEPLDEKYDIKVWWNTELLRMVNNSMTEHQKCINLFNGFVKSVSLMKGTSHIFDSYLYENMIWVP